MAEFFLMGMQDGNRGSDFNKTRNLPQTQDATTRSAAAGPDFSQTPSRGAVDAWRTKGSDACGDAGIAALCRGAKAALDAVDAGRCAAAAEGLGEMRAGTTRNPDLLESDFESEAKRRTAGRVTRGRRT
jgi:hypothetical protein